MRVKGRDVLLAGISFFVCVVSYAIAADPWCGIPGEVSCGECPKEQCCKAFPKECTHGHAAGACACCPEDQSCMCSAAWCDGEGNPHSGSCECIGQQPD
jgi:hypothetical protein